MALLLILATAAGAAGDDESGLRAGIEQRIALTRNYLESDTAAKIAASENPQARRLLEKSRELLDQASDALRQGKLLAAQEKVNLSLQSFTAAGSANLRKAPDPAVAKRELSALRTEIDSYLQAFTAALAEKGPSMAGLLDRQFVDGLLGNAEQAESIQDYANAKAALARNTWRSAENMMPGSIGPCLNRSTNWVNPKGFRNGMPSPSPGGWKA